jgi:CysZ protein
VDKRVATATRPVTEFFSGVGLLGRGLAMYARSPGLLLLGLVPAMIAFALLFSGFAVIVYFIGPESRAVTWFAHGWSTGARDLIQLIAGIAIIGVTALLAVVAFTAVTMAIGEPFYEKISEQVDQRFGGVPGAVAQPWWRGIWRGIGESIRLLAFSVVAGLLLFVAGLLPAIGQTVVPLIGALIGGWVLALQLTAVPFDRRGMRLRQRRQVLRQHRWLALGFGAAVFACFLIPFGAIIVMPAAVAGATLMARRLLP